MRLKLKKISVAFPPFPQNALFMQIPCRNLRLCRLGGEIWLNRTRSAMLNQLLLLQSASLPTNAALTVKEVRILDFLLFFGESCHLDGAFFVHQNFIISGFSIV